MKVLFTFLYLSSLVPKLFLLKSDNFNSENPESKYSNILGKITRKFAKISIHKFPDLVTKIHKNALCSILARKMTDPKTKSGF